MQSGAGLPAPTAYFSKHPDVILPRVHAFLFAYGFEVSAIADAAVSYCGKYPGCDDSQVLVGRLYHDIACLVDFALSILSR